MKKKIKIAVVSVLLAFVIFVVACIGWFVYIDEYMLTDTGTETSPDGKYAVSFQMVGSPDWPFGATSVKVTVRETEKNKQLKVINTSIQDDGANLSEYNWDVVWQSDTVEITLKGSEQDDVIYTVPLQ